MKRRMETVLHGCNGKRNRAGVEGDVVSFAGGFGVGKSGGSLKYGSKRKRKRERGEPRTEWVGLLTCGLYSPLNPRVN